MNHSYRPGLSIVLSTVLAALGICLVYQARSAGKPEAQRAGKDLKSLGLTLPAFQFVERSGRAVTNADFAGRVWIASAIFTRCPLSCPRISSVMKGLQGKLEGTNVLLVSLSVDPEHDTPAVLSDYARRFDANPGRWWFLTGPKHATHELIRKGFLLPVQESSPDEIAAGAEAVGHSDRLVLVEGDKTLGVYDSNDPDEIADLIARARRLDRGAVPGWARLLPPVNATLNALSAIALALGWFFIRSGNARAHATCMISAVVLSGLFLTCYLVYHAQVGSIPFEGTGPIRLVYFTILLSHTALATLGVVPLVSLTLFRAWKKQFDRHAAIARITFPIWMYVSVTGVIIYLMLYQLPLATPPTPL